MSKKSASDRLVENAHRGEAQHLRDSILLIIVFALSACIAMSVIVLIVRALMGQ